MPLEPDGFAAFVAARGPALARSAYVLTGDPHLAEDLVQSALAKALPRWSAIADPEAYVRRVMFTDHVSGWRRRRGTTEVPVERVPETREPGHETATVRRVALAAALARLSRRQRAVLVLRFLDDLTEAQAADVLGVTVGTVKSQTHDALRRLREVAPQLAVLAREPIEERR